MAAKKTTSASKQAPTKKKQTTSRAATASAGRAKAVGASGATASESVAAAKGRVSKASKVVKAKASGKAQSPGRKMTQKGSKTPVIKAVGKAPKAVAEKAAPAAGDDRGVLTAGSKVPPFEALDQTGEAVKSESLAGAPYVIYFYPKDDTPGCTTEACGFRDEMAAFAQSGVKVIGVSPDSTTSHARFAKKYGLGFTLLADTEKQLVNQFGVWKLKQNYGREYWGVERSTFLVDASGTIAKVWRGVKVAGHVPAVLQALTEL